MIVNVPGEGMPELNDIDNFQSFCISTSCGLDRLAEALSPIGRLEPDGHAWISRDWLFQNGRPDDSAWRAGFQSMLIVAERSHWIDSSGFIRAHVEFSI